MTYVYVLVSAKESDLYYEQCLMSVTSLRFYMPSANVVLLTDNKTDEGMTESAGRSSLRGLASKVIAVPFDDGVMGVDRSRLIKTSIPDYVDDDFLYIDCDTVICAPLDGVLAGEYQTAGVKDGHCGIEEHVHKKMFLERDKRLGFDGTRAAGCNVNGGVIFARKGEESKALFKEWHALWCYSAYKKGDKHDQSALNEAIRITRMHTAHLAGEWNCQPSHGGLAFLEKARIIHYYSSEGTGKHYIPYYKIGDSALQRRVKEAGCVPPDVMDMLRNPRFQFNAVHIVSDRRILSVMQSPLLFTLADIKSHLPRLFAAMEGIARRARKAAGKAFK